MNTLNCSRLLPLALLPLCLAFGCGNEPIGVTPIPGNPGTSTPPPEPTPTLVDLDRPCSQVTAAAELANLGAPYALAVDIPALFDALQADALPEDAPLEWVACGPGGERIDLEGGSFVSLTLTSPGAWAISAFDGPSPIVGGEVEVFQAPGATMRFDRGQVGQTSQGHDLGALPWPSDLYREPGTGRITLTEGSLFDWAPEAMVGIAPLMVNGLRKGWESMDAFPISSSLLLTTTTTATTDAFKDYDDPQAFTELGAPAFLIEVGADGRLESGRRLPLQWRYSGVEGLDKSRVRNALELYLAPGQSLGEGREYVYILTSRAGGSGGAWARGSGFDRFLETPQSGEPEGAQILRDRLEEAVATQADLPSMDVIIAAGRFTTRRFTHQMESIADCIYESECEAIPGLEEPPPVYPIFPKGSWVYWDTVPTAGPPAESSHRLISRLLRDAPQTFPLDAYRLIAFGYFQSPIFQGVDPNLVGDGPIDPAEPNPAIRDVFVEGEEGLEVYGVDSLRFMLILPKGEAPPEGYPVMIFVHGLGRDMLDAFLASEILAPEGVAILALDQVAHGSRFDVSSIATADAINNFSAMEYQAEDGAGEGEEPWASTGDGVSDARVSPGYGTTSILNFFEWMGNFRAMGDNFRQLAVDLMQLERMVLEADRPGGLNATLRSWGLAPLSTARPLVYGRSLGSLALGVFLPYAPGERAAILGVPGGGFATHLASNSPFIGNLLTQAAQIAKDCATQDVCTDVDELEDIIQFSPEATEFLRPGDPFTHLVQGLLEPGDAFSMAHRLAPEGRSEALDLLVQYACDDEILPNPAVYELARRLNLPSLNDVDLPEDLTLLKEGEMISVPTRFGPLMSENAGMRLGVMDNRGGSTQGMIAYCPGSHSGVYDRLDVRDEVYSFYPDGPFPGGTEVIFPALEEPIPVSNAYLSAREALVNFVLTSLEGEAVITAPHVEYIWDMDGDGVPNDLDACPYGPENAKDPGGSGPCP